MFHKKAIAKSTIVFLLSFIGVSLLTLVFSSSAAAVFVEADPRAAPGAHQMAWSDVDAPEVTGTVTDTTMVDFQAGPGGCYVAPSAGNDWDGEVILTPTIGITFTGSALPTGWYSGTYDVAGEVTISDGLLTATGAYAGPTATYLPSQTLEFSATFRAEQGEHIGLTTSPDLNGGLWAIFSTSGLSGTQLYVRTRNLDFFEDTPLGSSYLGTGHRYRIEWTPTRVVYSIDGVVKAINTSVPISATYRMRPIVSNIGSAKLVVDWLRMSSASRTCTFYSRVLDSGGDLQWYKLTARVVQPPDTGIGSFQTRTGMTSTVDSSWSSWSSVNGTGITSPNRRYIQYRVVLTSATATANRANTPAVESVALAYTSLALQTITFDPLPNKVFGDPPFVVTATASSGLTVRFTASGSCTSSGANGATVTLTGVGTCTVTAFQDGDATYAPAPEVLRTFNIKGIQTITFDPLPDKVFGDPPFVVTATASSGLAVTFTASGSCTSSGANGATVTLTGVGTCTVTAQQAGNTNWAPAPDVARSFEIWRKVFLPLILGNLP